MARRLLALTLLGTLTVEGWAPDARVVSQRAPVSRPVIRAAEAEDTPASPEGSELSAEFNKLITDEKMQDFNDELYAHLGKRPEFETSEVYKNLRKRVDVSDPLSSELDQIKAFRSGPTPEATPGDVIENVLRALRDVDSPSANAGPPRSPHIDPLPTKPSPTAAPPPSHRPNQQPCHFTQPNLHLTLPHLTQALSCSSSIRALPLPSARPRQSSFVPTSRRPNMASCSSGCKSSAWRGTRNLSHTAPLRRDRGSNPDPNLLASASSTLRQVHA